MSLIIKEIPNELSYDDLYDYFTEYGRINDFRIKYNYGYITFNNTEVERKVYNAYHKLKGFKLLIERGEMERCVHCPLHCKKVREPQQKVHPLDKFKVVLDNIPECNVIELKDFVRSFRLDPVYARITQSGQHGIVEFGSIEAKEDALRLLDNIPFKNLQINCRPYYNRERRRFDDDFKRREFMDMKKDGDKGMQMEKEELCDDLKGWNENIIDSGKK